MIVVGLAPSRLRAASNVDNLELVISSRYKSSKYGIIIRIPTSGDPLEALASAFLHKSMDSAAKYEPDGKIKGQFLADLVGETGAEGVIFAAPSFCDPALLDRPMLANVLDARNIPYIAFQYAENSGQMQPIREQAGTFADSIKLWSAA